MIQFVEKKKCVGCNACVQRCPKGCIRLEEDEEGFLYPKTDSFLCIDCHLCEKVCPVIFRKEKRQPLKVYAMRNRDENIRFRSSSGGIFYLLAAAVLAREITLASM